MKSQKSDFDFDDFVSKYKINIFRDNGDLTLPGALIFITYGIALILAIRKLQKKGKK